jgi:hypothetical protein
MKVRTHGRFPPSFRTLIYQAGSSSNSFPNWDPLAGRTLVCTISHINAQLHASTSSTSSTSSTHVYIVWRGWQWASPMLKLFYTIFHCESGVSLVLLEAGDGHCDNLMFKVQYKRRGSVPWVYTNWWKSEKYESASKANLYTWWSQGWKNLRPTSSVFSLLFGPRLLINARTLASQY